MKKIIFSDRIKQEIGLDIFEDLSDHEILTAYSHEDALRLHRKEKAALIVVELYGPGMHAAQLCAQIREDPGLRDVSMIVCCRENEIEVREARQCRANAIMTLPLRGSLLRERIHEFLNVPVRGRYHAHFSAWTKRTPRSAISCHTENISVSGMLIRTDAELHPGDRLRYSLDLASERSFAMEGDVVRADRVGYGVRFSHLDPAARRAIESLVRHRPPVL